MNALLTPPDQFPGDFELTGDHEADDDPRTYREVWESEQQAQRECARLRNTICELHAQLAKLPPMPPTPDDINW